MPISATRDRLEAGLLSFVWDEWSQMGLLSEPRRLSPWAQDPEALLLLTLEVARVDPRLFDEVLDWLVRNEHLVSVRRLRTLTRGGADPTLTDAVLSWLAQHRPKARFSNTREQKPPEELRRLFLDRAFPIRRRDEAFAEHGWLRPEASPSGNASAPDLRAPINFDFRLRCLLGTGTRAEVVRFLLCTDAPRSTASVVAQSAAYAKRNVQEALNELQAAGVVTGSTRGNEARYGVDHERWASLLDHEGPFPTHGDWVQLLGGLGKILRWLRVGVLPDTTEYLQASGARTLLEDVRVDMEWAGILMPQRQTSGEALDDLDSVVTQSLGLLRAG